MPRTQNHKLKLLYLLKILAEHSDAEHPLTAPEIIRALEGYGIAAERKSLYDDLLALEGFGITVERTRDGNRHGYYLDTRLFDMPELKLLVDAVQSAKFVTKEKSRALIEKLASTVSRAEARRLSRQVYVADRAKTENTAVFSAVDVIHTAIEENKKIRFRYFSRNEKKERVLHRNGAFYIVSPFALAWSEENYYLIAYDGETESVRHYRVDRMLHVSLSDEKRDGQTHFERFDMAHYTMPLFGMFTGNAELVTLSCHNRLATVILDRFGDAVTLIPDGSDRFRVTVSVVPGPHFYAYTFGFGADMQILSPPVVVSEARRLLQECVDLYQK